MVRHDNNVTRRRPVAVTRDRRCGAFAFSRFAATDRPSLVRILRTRHRRRTAATGYLADGVTGDSESEEGRDRGVGSCAVVSRPSRVPRTQIRARFSKSFWELDLLLLSGLSVSGLQS